MRGPAGLEAHACDISASRPIQTVRFDFPSFPRCALAIRFENSETWDLTKIDLSRLPNASSLDRSPDEGSATDPTWRSHPSLWTQAYAHAPLEIALQPSAAARGRGGHMWGRMPQEEPGCHPAGLRKGPESQLYSGTNR